jgi:hypothetical protein
MFLKHKDLILEYSKMADCRMPKEEEAEANRVFPKNVFF